MFSFKSSNPLSPIFGPSDIQTLIQTFPPPAPTPGRDSLVRSRSGKNLVRSSSVTKRFLALLETSEHDILTNSLSLELGVHDMQWLLEQERASLFFTKDAERILTRQRQKGVVHALREAVSGGAGIQVSAWASKSDVSVETLTRLLKAEAVTLEQLDDGLSYDADFLANVRNDVFQVLREARNEVVDLARAGQGLPTSWIEETSRQIMAEKHDVIEGSIVRRASGVFFTPSAAQSLLEQQKEEAMRAQVAGLLQELDRDGYCSVIESPVLDRAKQTWDQSHPDVPLVHLRSVHTAYAVLIQKGTLRAKEKQLGEYAIATANQVWNNRQPGQEIVFSEPTFLASLEADTALAKELPLCRLILENDLNVTSDAFTASIIKLKAAATLALADYIRSNLLAPVTLYTSGLATIKDETLYARVADHVFEHLRRTLVPEVVARIRTDKDIAPSTKFSLRALDKFDNAVRDAKSITEITTAATRLGRYVRSEQLDAVALRDCKLNLLRDRVNGMRKMKRGSDLLQNVIWVLLATSCGRDGLFLSGGKDTSRMVKLAQGDLGDRAEGKRIGELRDLIKEGKDGDVERMEMREMANKALSDWEST